MLVVLASDGAPVLGRQGCPLAAVLGPSLCAALRQRPRFLYPPLLWSGPGQIGQGLRRASFYFHHPFRALSADGPTHILGSGLQHMNWGVHDSVHNTCIDPRPSGAMQACEGMNVPHSISGPHGRP